MCGSIITEYRQNKGRGCSWQAGGSREATLIAEDEELNGPMPHGRRPFHRAYGRPGFGV